MKTLRVPPQYKCIGLVDADLMDNGTRHPNLVLLKIAGFLYDNHIRFELITEDNINLSRYSHIYLSRVFTFTTLPKFYTQALGTKDEEKFHVGGTGFYATETSVSTYRKKRNEDMEKLETDSFLNQFPNMRGGRKKMGIDMARQMPYYHLYDKFVEKKVAEGKKRSYYKDYLELGCPI